MFALFGFSWIFDDEFIAIAPAGFVVVRQPNGTPVRKPDGTLVFAPI